MLGRMFVNFSLTLVKNIFIYDQKDVFPNVSKCNVIYIRKDVFPLIKYRVIDAKKVVFPNINKI